MRAVPLFASSVVVIREVVCDAARGGHGGIECSTAPSIAIPLRGCYSVDRKRETILADANTAILFDPKLPYRVAHPADDGDASAVFDFAPAALSDAFGEAGRPSVAPLRPALQLQLHLLRRLLATRAADSLAVEEAALALLAQLAQASRVPRAHVHRVAVERAKAYLGQNFREKVTLTEVSRAASVSSFGLTRAFRAVAGTTLHRYLTQLRLAAALDAVAAGATDLSAVAADAGFAHHSHFTSRFTRAFGKTPSRTRAMLGSLREKLL